MQEDNNRNNQSAADKAEPQNIAGRNEEQAKQKTEPLKSESHSTGDKQEGNMDNGELGSGLKKEESQG